MREALDGGDVYRRRNLLDYSRTRGNPDRRLAIRIGKAIFRQAGIPSLLTELRDIAIGEFLAVALSDEPFINEYSGAVALGLQWIVERDDTKSGRFILVQAWPLSRKRGLSGRVTEIMSPSKYRSRPRSVADGLARAYRDPFVIGG